MARIRKDRLPPRFPKTTIERPTISTSVRTLPTPTTQPPVAQPPRQPVTFQQWLDRAEFDYRGKGGLYGLARASLDGRDVAPKPADFVSYSDFDRANRLFSKAKTRMAEQRVRQRSIERQAGPRPEDTKDFYWKPARRDGVWYWEKHDRPKGAAYTIDPVTGEPVYVSRKPSLGEVQVLTKEGIETVYTRADISPGMEEFITGSTKTGYRVDVAGALRAGHKLDELQKLGISNTDISLIAQALDRDDIVRKLREQEYQAEAQARRKSIEELLPYSRGDDQYDIAKFLRDNPQKTELLRRVGFSNEDIAGATKYNEQPFIETSSLESWWDKVKQAGGSGLNMLEFQEFLRKNPDLAREGREVAKTPLPEATSVPRVSLDQFIADFMAARGLEPVGASTIVSTREQKEARELAMTQYARTYGTSGLAKAGAETTAAFLFAPARAIYPEVQLSDITPIEWGVGGAQVALLLAPIVTSPLKAAFATRGARLPLLATKVVERTIRGGAGLMFTTATAQSWNDMTEGDRAMAVAIDTLVLGSALSGIKGLISKKPGVLTGKAINTAAKLGKKPSIKLATDLPVKDMAWEMSSTRLITEGGKVGAGWEDASNLQLTQAVGKGKKPLALIYITEYSTKVLQTIREQRLKVRFVDRVRLDKGSEYYAEDLGKYIKLKKPAYLRMYYVYKNNPTGKLALNRILNADKISLDSPENVIYYHTEVGKAFGYEPRHIRAFLQHLADLDIADAEDFALKNILNDVSYAIRTRDEFLLKRAATRLQLVAAARDIPLLFDRARLMIANPNDFVSLARTKLSPTDIKDIENSLRGNKAFIDNAERALKRVKDPTKRAKIEEALKTARKQIIATKVKTKPLIELTPEFPKGKYPLAKVTTKALTITKKITPKEKKVTRLKARSKTGKATYVPLSAFGKMTYAQIAQRYGLENADAVIWAVAIASPSIQEQIRQLQAQLTETQLKERPMEMPYPVTAPETMVKPLAQPKLKEITQPKLGRPTPFPVPIPIPRPTPVKLPVEGMTPEQKEEAFRSAYAWKQGFGWWAVNEMGQSAFFKKPLPTWKIIKKGTPFETIQVTRGIPPVEPVSLDLGIMDITVRSPAREPGKVGAIKFKRDIAQRTKGDIKLGKEAQQKKRKKRKPRQRLESLVVW